MVRDGVVPARVPAVERLCADYGTPILASSGSSDGIALGASAPSACEVRVGMVGAMFAGMSA